MDILSSRMISLKTKIQIMHVSFFLFQKNYFKGKIYLPKAIKMRRKEIEEKEYSKGQVCKTENTIKSKYNHPLSPELYLFNTNIKVCRTDEWVTREGKAKALKCCSLESITIIKQNCFLQVSLEFKQTHA